MNFDWARAIERNFAAIESIVMLLHSLAGISSLRPIVATLPRRLHIRILSILRPAEYAARRLIVMVAATRGFPIRPRREARPGAAPQPGMAPLASRSERIPAFQLFDPFKPAGAPWLTAEEIAALDDPDAAPFVAAGLPPDEPVDAHSLCRRIAALRHALGDLDGHALRLARWRARRAAEISSGRGLTRVRPQRWSPFRPGRPPGWAKRPKTDVAEVLKECDLLARDAWSNFDTS